MARERPAEAEDSPRRPRASAEHQWLATAVFAASTALVTLALVAGSAPHERGQRFLLAFVACGPIALLRRWPVPVLAAATVVNALVMAGGNAPLPFGIMLGLASYLVASQLPRRVSIPAVAASAAALAVALLYAALAVTTAPVAVEAVEGFPPLVAAWFIGDSVAARRHYVAGLAEQMERERAAEAERARQQVLQERVRIARELHDVVAHTLAKTTWRSSARRPTDGRRSSSRRTSRRTSSSWTSGCR